MKIYVITLRFFTLLCMFFISQPICASDSYDSSTGILSISSVAVGDTLYSTVKITIGGVISVGTQTTDSYDTYNGTTLTIPVVTVGTTTYYNVVVTVGTVISVGSTCSGVSKCYTSLSSESAKYSVPATYTSLLQQSYNASNLVSVSSFVTNSIYMISDALSASTSANYLSIGSTYSATTGYSVESGSISAASTYDTYFTKLVEVVSDSYGYFRIDSHKHPNNALDFDASDSNRLKFRNNFGKAASLYGYVTFAYDSSTKLLQAKKRYKYSYTTTSNTNGTTSSAVSYTEDTAFTAANYYVNVANGIYSLQINSSSATPLYLYNSPLELGIPEFMNPNKVSFVTNGPAPFISKTTVAATEGTSGSIYKQVNATYRSQVLTPGADATTKINADAMLASIKSTVEASGEKLRYATAVYTAYRDATLASKLVSDSISDGTPGQNLVPYVYFTNEKDATTGKYHPFMIVVTYGNQASPNGLKNVPHPPGDGSGEYPTSKVTRFSNLENYMTAISMKDYGQVSVVTENTFTRNLWIDMPTTAATANVYTYADSSDNGLLIDGAVIFPTYNNTLVPSHLAGELSASGCHVGQGGGGPHCHSDGYQSGFSLGVYNDKDYISKTHPPLIGFGYDGIALFAKYRDSDTAMLGYSTALDAFGGHNHDDIGYHYHAHVVTNHKPELLSSTTTMYVLMKGAYIGKTNTIPYFRQNTSFNNNKYLGGTVK